MRNVLCSLCLISLLSPLPARALERADEAPPAAKVATSTAFTYQGRLVLGGAAVNQPSDLRFTLYDASAGGALVGGPISVQSVDVVAGGFAVPLDFGAGVFTGDARWLEIEVRSPHDPSDSLPYTLLTPRQELTAVPYALHALSAPGGGGSGYWQLSGGVITNTGATRVLINRTNIVGSEYFGIHGPTSSYAGMYITTEGDPGKPFYGYKAGANAAMWTYQDGNSGEWRVYNGGDRLKVRPSGEVDVGSTVTIDNSDASHSGGEIQLRTGGGVLGLQLNGAGGGATQGGSISVFNDGNSGIATAVLDGEYGESGGGALVLRNATGAQTIELAADLNPGDRSMIRMYQPDGTKTVEIDTEETGAASQGATVKLYNDTGALTIELDADFGSSNQGRITADVIEITGGADFSEQFDITSHDGVIDPGSVVSIDPGAPGELCLSGRAYDRRVAGIVSGAGGVRPGMLMGQRGSEADGRHPVALTGRVYCKVDASFGAIEPGDLLTTSPTPGHAMKVSDSARAAGAVLGKAMTGLDSGRGLVLVLVSLQ